MRLAASELKSLGIDMGENGIDLSTRTNRARLERLLSSTPVSYDDSEEETGNDVCDSDTVEGIDTGQESNQVKNGTTCDSDLAGMNSNTNGKVVNNDLLDNGRQANGPHDNMNDNRQMPDIPVLKTVKQLNMGEVPLHLSGLSLSGSGLQLFVKIDENLEKALCKKPAIVKGSTVGRKRKKTTRTKKPNESHGALSGNPPCNDQGLATIQIGFGNKDSPMEIDGLDVKDEPMKGPKEKMSKEDEIIPPLISKKTLEAVVPQSRANGSDPIPRDIVCAHSQQSYHPYGCHQNFQPTSSNLQSNVISGPTWHVENGHIDVIKSQDKLPSTSHVGLPTTPKHYEEPIDCSLNPFIGGFKSKDLPLKRRLSSPRWRRHGFTSPCLPKRRARWRRHRKDSHCSDFGSSDFNQYNYDDDDDDEMFKDCCVDKDFTRKDLRENSIDEKKEKSRNKTVTRKARASVSDDVVAANSQPTNTKRKVSEVSIADQSSVGPQFETDLLTLRSSNVDAETLVKFTQYTHDLRKDLKQKYKDLSKIVKSFEKTMQERNSSETEQAQSTTSSQDGRCCIM